MVGFGQPSGTLHETLIATYYLSVSHGCIKEEREKRSYTTLKKGIKECDILEKRVQV